MSRGKRGRNLFPPRKGGSLLFKRHRKGEIKTAPPEKVSQSSGKKTRLRFPETTLQKAALRREKVKLKRKSSKQGCTCERDNTSSARDWFLRKKRAYASRNLGTRERGKKRKFPGSGSGYGLTRRKGE